nr:hypothetical protein Itr_chr02CG23610 [Ipomoea trifida]
MFTMRKQLSIRRRANICIRAHHKTRNSKLFGASLSTEMHLNTAFYKTREVLVNTIFGILGESKLLRHQNKDNQSQISNHHYRRRMKPLVFHSILKQKVSKF